MNCAFFDVDGTLLEGFMIQSPLRFLADKGIVGSRYTEIISIDIFQDPTKPTTPTTKELELKFH